MNNLDNRLTHNVKTEFRNGIHKTALAAEKQLAERKTSSSQGTTKTLKEQNQLQKNEVRRAYNDLIRGATTGGGTGEIDMKKLRKKMQFVKHPPLPLPTPSKVSILCRVRFRVLVESTNHPPSFYFASGWILPTHDIEPSSGARNRNEQLVNVAG